MNQGNDQVLRGWYSARAMLAAEWTPAILVTLLDGPRHYTELLSIVGTLRPSDGWNRRHETLHESTLTRTLKQLTDDDLIQRDELPGLFPQSVLYTLTSAARELVESVVPMAEWSERHLDLVEGARQRRHE